METMFLTVIFVLTGTTCGLLQTMHIQTIVNYTVCDFEQHNLCGYTHDEIGKAWFHWTWHSGSTLSSATGPSADHTTGTSAGHYIYIETTNAKPNDTARIMSPVYRAKNIGPHCISFWYHMYGADVNTLNVYMFAISNLGANTLIWTRSFDQGDTWKAASVTVKPGGGVFQLFFEGVRGNDFRGDIAIDDVSVANGACRAENPVSCDFDYDFCGWNQIMDPMFYWVRTNYYNTEGQLGDQNGHRSSIYTKYSDPFDYWMHYSWKDLSALLISPVLPRTSNKGSCFSLWYYVSDFSSGSLSIFTFSDYGYTLQWNDSDIQGNKWQQAELTIVSSTDYKIVIEGKIPVYTNVGTIAIDDIRFEDTQCEGSSRVTQSSLQTIYIRTIDNYTVCDFEEQDLCGYTQDGIKADFTWTWHSGSTRSSLTGPSADHTEGTYSGHYIYIETSIPRQPNDAARILSHGYRAQNIGPHCISFWYHMYGVDVNTLNVYMVTQSDINAQTLIWTKTSNQGDEWKQAAVTVTPDGYFQLLFEGVRGNDFRGDIAIDDVSVANGACRDLQTIYIETIDNYTICDFEEHNLCGFTQDGIKADFKWTWRSGSTPSSETGPSADHTTGISSGHYIYIETSDPRKPNDAARILSHGYRSKNIGPHCISFWYHMYGFDVSTLNVYMVAQSDINAQTLIWKKTSNQGDEWKQAAVTVATNDYFQLLFEGVRGNDFRGDIAIDDVSVANGACRDWGADICDNGNCVPISSVPCGSRSVNFKYRIFGGSTAAPGEVPWQVGVRYGNNAWCGGTILGDFWILSAAHCFSHSTKYYTVRTGDFDNTVQDNYEEEFELSHLIKHHLFNDITADYDLALLKIEPKKGTGGIQFNKHVKPACLPTKTTAYIVDQECLVSGWGSISKGVSSKMLQHAVVPLRDNTFCQEKHEMFTSRMMCAGYREGGIDTCFGDSGGGLVCQINGHYTLMGVTSFGGFECAHPDSPTVYTNVTELISWIHATIRKFS